MLVTYIMEDEVKNLQSVEDKEINELYQKVRKYFDNKYLLKEQKHYQKRWFKTITTFQYTLCFCRGYMEYQIVLLVNENRDNNRAAILNYLKGILDGMEYEKIRKI